MDRFTKGLIYLLVFAVGYLVAEVYKLRREMNITKTILAPKLEVTGATLVFPDGSREEMKKVQ